jgi:hypothetical protein
VELERRGIAAAVICTTTFEGLAARAAEALGVEGLPLVVIRHPLGGLGPEEVAARAREVTAYLAARARRPEAGR